MGQTILIVEDEERIAHWVQAYLKQAGFRALIAGDGPAGLHLFRTERPDLIILDLMLPGLDGTDVCRVVRAESDVPIIMVTARGRESDRILGLELGADDYVVKPFSPSELVARVRAVLRRVNGNLRAPEVLGGGGICLDLKAHTCTVGGQSVELSPTQFSLMETLMRHSGRALSRQQLLDAAFEGYFEGYERTIDVHIRRLRKRIERDPANPQYILTVFGVGYKFVE